MKPKRIKEPQARQAVSAMTHIKDLVPDPANRRTHNPRNIGMVVDALQHVGAARSIVIDENGVVLAGNGVLEAAGEAGITRLRVVDADGQELIAVRRTGLSEAQKRHLAIADNRTAELASWSAAQFKEDLEGGKDFAAFFTKNELAAILGQDAATTANADDEAEQSPTDGPCDSQIDRIYELGPHRLACGDSTDAAVVEAVLDGAKPKLWICDPPYDLSYFLWPLLPSIDVVAVWHRGKSAYQWMGQTFADDAWGVHGLVFTGGVRGQHRPSLPCCMHDHVSMWRRKWWTDELTAIDPAVIRASGCKKTIDDRPVTWQEHVGGVLTGAEGMSWGKPVLENAIAMAYVPAGSVVWDPCAGSGSSLLAAAQHGRVWRGVEQQPKWCDLIRRRWTRWADKQQQESGAGALRQVVDSTDDSLIRSAGKRARIRPPTTSPARQGRAANG